MKINFHRWAAMSEAQRRALCRRAEADTERILPAVAEIIAEVRRSGDAALRRFSRQFDGADLAGLSLRIGEEEFAAAEKEVEPAVREAIAFAVENVRRYHQTQRPQAMSLTETRPGVFAGERFTPIASVGLYVPRGRGSFPSVAYMLAVPAVLAGVPRAVLVSPPDARGRLDPATLYAARLCGLEEAYRVGGAQAVAALAYGTESLPRVDKILGPGGIYVAAAKRAVSSVVDVGLPAGPSESVVLADESAEPRQVALDLLVEAEHGSDSSAFLATPSAGLADEVRRILPGLLKELDGERAAFVEQVLSGYGGIVLTETLEEAVDFVNAFAPEHLMVVCREPWALLDRVRNAGEILLGEHSGFSLANYAVGCNHVLPTGGWARSSSALSLRDFLKASSVVYLTEGGLAGLSGPVARLASYEGFSAHALAVTARPAARRD
jgi:histidinol dehydrogenase